MTTDNSDLLNAIDQVLDERSLEWAAQWIQDSLKGETNERVIEFGNNMAMTLRAAAQPAASTPTVATSRKQMLEVLGEPPWTLGQIAKEFEFITVGALLETEPPAASTSTDDDNCVKCGHSRWLSQDDGSGICKHIIDDPVVCGCKCEFDAAASTEAQNDE